MENEKGEIDYLLQSEEIRKDFGEILTFLAENENPELAEIKNKITEMSARLRKMVEQKKAGGLSKKELKELKKERGAARKELTAILNLAKPKLEKLVAAERLDPNSTIEEFLRKRGILGENPAKIKSEFEEFEFYSEEDRNPFWISFVNCESFESISLRIKDAEVEKKIGPKRFEINWLDFVLQTGEAIIETGCQDFEIKFDPKKVDLFFAEFRKKWEEIRDNPQKKNDLNFFKNADEIHFEMGCYLRVHFEKMASIARERIVFQKPENMDPRTFDRLREDIFDRMKYFDSTFLRAFLSETALNLDYKGKGWDYGYDLLSVRICLARAEKFIKNFEILDGIKKCQVGFGKKDKNKTKPFLRLSSVREEGHKNLFPDGIKFSGGGSFDSKAFFAQILESGRFGGDLPMSYFFETATKIEIEESNDEKHPDKFKIEVGRARHEKWVAENLSNPK